MQSTRYFCQILIKFQFSRQIFEISSHIKFHENPSSGTFDAVTHYNCEIRQKESYDTRGFTSSLLKS